MVIRINDVCLLPLAYLCHVIGSLLVGQSHVIVCLVGSGAPCLGRWVASLDSPECVIGVLSSRLSDCGVGGELAVCLHLTVVTAGAGAFLLCSAGCPWGACPHTSHQQQGVMVMGEGEWGRGGGGGLPTHLRISRAA